MSNGRQRDLGFRLRTANSAGFRRGSLWFNSPLAHPDPRFLTWGFVYFEASRLLVSSTGVAPALPGGLDMAWMGKKMCSDLVVEFSRRAPLWRGGRAQCAADGPAELAL